MTSNLSTYIDPQHFRTLSVGFDNVFESIFDNVSTSNYPPYNIIKHNDENFTIELAVAGFEKDDIEIETKENRISIRSVIAKNVETKDSDDVYLHKGISKRQFNRTFTLASDVFVKDASMVNGLLKIHLERIIPDEKRPRLISIN
jgi:molecular chaperone IbpA